MSADDIYLEKADKRTCANHPHKFKTKGPSTKELKNFFTHRSIPEWNNLPASVVEASTPETFKVRLAGLGLPNQAHAHPPIGDETPRGGLPIKSTRQDKTATCLFCLNLMHDWSDCICCSAVLESGQTTGYGAESEWTE